MTAPTLGETPDRNLIETITEDLIYILGDDHDEEECDNLADLIEEVRALITRLRREANGRPFARLPNQEMRSNL